MATFELETPWRIIVHGGATDSCPSVSRQNDIKHALNLIVAHAAKLLNEGAYAKDVVAKTVMALEDCPLFNAGKGSAMSKDGVCEVNTSGFNGFELT